MSLSSTITSRRRRWATKNTHQPPKPNRFTTLQHRVSPHTRGSTDSKPQEASVVPAWRSTSHNTSHDTSTSLQLAAPGPHGARTGSGVQRLELHVSLLARLWFFCSCRPLGWLASSGLWKNPGNILRSMLVSTNGLDLWPCTRTILTFEAESGIRIMLVKLSKG